MDIFDLPQKENLHKDEMELLQQKKHEFVLIGRERKIPGHTLFSYNTQTGEIKVAPVQYSQDVDFKTHQPIHKPKIVIEPNCVYRQALNKKNFIKRLKRDWLTMTDDEKLEEAFSKLKDQWGLTDNPMAKSIFQAGAYWMRQQTTNKACEWLDYNLGRLCGNDCGLRILKEFKQAMEG